MPILKTITDIDPIDPTILELDKLAGQFGILNLTVVLYKISQLKGENGQRLLLFYDETNYREIVGAFLSMSAINFAAAKYEYFSIPVNSDLAQNFFRNHGVEEHVTYARKYLEQAKQVIEQYR